MIRSSVPPGPQSATTRQLRLRGSLPPSAGLADTVPADMAEITSLTPPAAAPTIVPDGRQVSSVPRTELYSILARLKIPGFSHQNGIQTNVEAYEAHLRSIAAAAGQAAVSEWLGAHRSV